MKSSSSRRIWLLTGTIGLLTTTLSGVAHGQSLSSAGETSRLTVSVEPREITVGDHTQARLTLFWEGPQPIAEPAFPAWQRSWGRAEVVETGGVEVLRAEGTRTIYRQSLVLTAFDIGTIELPPMAVQVPLPEGTVTLELPGSELVVRSLLPAEPAEATPRQPAPPRAPKPSHRFWWTASVLAFGCLGLAAMLATRLRAAASAAAEPLATAPPLNELLTRLDTIDPSRPEPAHTHLSLHLRAFLARRMAFSASESTTLEIRDALIDSPVSDEVAGGLLEILQTCDLVKFAELRVDTSVTEERVRITSELARGLETEIARLQARRTEGTRDDSGHFEEAH